MSKSEVDNGGKSKLLVVGSIIELVLAFICMFFGVFATSIFLTETYRYQDYHFQLQNAVGIVGLVAFAFGFAGAILSFKRRHFPFAIFGTFVIMAWAVLFAELALMVPGSYERLTGVMFAMFTFIFSVISLVFIAVSRKRFTKHSIKEGAES